MRKIKLIWSIHYDLYSVSYSKQFETLIKLQWKFCFLTLLVKCFDRNFVYILINLIKTFMELYRLEGYLCNYSVPHSSLKVGRNDMLLVSM